MELSKHLKNGFLKVRVVPHSGRTELVEENNTLRLYLKAVPEKNKANLELIKFFKKNYKLSVEIKSGATGREKLLKVYP